MMKTDRILILGLVAAVAALGATSAWAVVRATDKPSTAHYYGAMMGSPSGGMMRSGSSSMMGSGGMMAYSSGARTAAPVSTPAEAKALAQQFADQLGLKADEVLQFERNFYVKLVDKNGAGATEVLVDPQTGTVSLEYGPAMMWNTRYGLHGENGQQMMGSYGAGMMGGGSGGMMGSGSGGMMGGSGGMMGGTSGTGSSGTGTPVALDQARQVAQRWLSANRAGLEVESGGDSFPGYYTFEVLKQGKIQGMLSVNASSSAVIYHWWHGAFLTEMK